ncbi:hypothetical protein V9T40_008246 [Parthenolecanium corni]|uniref:Uncharacterized protein n=1 Tax=Parthenolecanium corni TaxID=536013 RepID=A0AAN9TQ82_9HEMI
MSEIVARRRTRVATHSTAQHSTAQHSTGDGADYTRWPGRASPAVRSRHRTEQRDGGTGDRLRLRLRHRRSRVDWTRISKRLDWSDGDAVRRRRKRRGGKRRVSEVEGCRRFAPEERFVAGSDGGGRLPWPLSSSSSSPLLPQLPPPARPTASLRPSRRLAIGDPLGARIIRHRHRRCLGRRAVRHCAAACTCASDRHERYLQVDVKMRDLCSRRLDSRSCSSRARAPLKAHRAADS